MAEFDAEDLEYQQLDGKPMLARRYRPRGTGPFPAVVEVHGGAWTSGDRLNNVDIATALAADGIAVLSLEFRMPPQAAYPAVVADVNLGIRWGKAHAAELGSRPELIGGLGTSSGGHLLLLNSLRPRDPRYAALPLAGGGAVDARLPYIIACWPVADPLARYRAVTARGNDRLVQAHHQFWPVPDAMGEGNPQLILERGEPAELPPALVLQGTNDDNLTPDMADRFVAAYRQRGGQAQLEKFEGQPHTFISKDPTSAASLKALTLIKAFIHQQTGIG
ncbi:MAG: alpha/beta hydrolase [Pseudomonadota bacterium]